MSQPAARMGDMQTCPLSEGSKPHVGGPIAKGEPPVLIGGQPAAHAGDPTVHGGTVAGGFGSVLIG